MFWFLFVFLLQAENGLQQLLVSDNMCLATDSNRIDLLYCCDLLKHLSNKTRMPFSEQRTGIVDAFMTRAKFFCRMDNPKCGGSQAAECLLTKLKSHPGNLELLQKLGPFAELLKPESLAYFNKAVTAAEKDTGAGTVASKKRAGEEGVAASSSSGGKKKAPKIGGKMQANIYE